MLSDYRDNDYANIESIEYIFGDLDDYYKPILVQGLFNNNYQRYYCRGDPTRQLSINTYLDKIIPYIKILIDENKISEQKIQLDIGINLIHITDKKRITHFTKSENIKCLPSNNTDDILNKLLKSLYEKYQEDIKLCHTSSSFIYESVEELNIHFNKIDLQRGALYIPTPNWIKNKKAIINTKNTNDTYCFMYAITIALYHKELGANPERISKRQFKYIPTLNWDGIDFPPSYNDYNIFEKFNEDIALNVLHVPFNKKTICSEYISNRNYTAKKNKSLC